MEVWKHFWTFIVLILMQNCVENSSHDSDSSEQEIEQDLHLTEDEVQPRVETGRMPHQNDEDEDSSNDNEKNSKALPDENDVVVDYRIADEKDQETGGPILPNSDETLIALEKNFYSFDVLNIDGEKVHLKKYRDKISLVVNVASECGFTDAHYKGLVRIQSILSPTKKFNVLAFPCNQFGAQEPWDNNQIKTFVEERYQVNFPMFSKIRVLDSDIPEAWKYLQEKSGKVPNWNFWKYLVNEDGHVVEAWGPWASVEDIFDQVKAAVDRIARPKDPELPKMVNDHSEL